MIKSNEFMKAYLQIIKESAEEPQDEQPPVDADSTVKADDTTETQSAEGLKQVCFKTSDQTLIDAINSGFEEVVVFVKAKDDDGKDTVTEVKFKPESFGEFSVCDVPAEGGECPECGKNPCACEDGETCPQCGKNPCVCECDGNAVTECNGGNTVTEDPDTTTTDPNAGDGEDQ